MNRLEELSNFEYPLIQQTVRRIILDETTDLKKLEKIFYFVRDEIKFGFPKNGDFDKASEVLSKKLGQCNTKGTLFLAFCKAVGIEARIHYSTIKKEIQWGLFRGFAYKLLPDLLSHSWIEINLDGKWRKIDAYINDRRFFEAAKKELKRRGMDVGFSVSCPNNHCPSEFNLEEELFQQMGSVVDDQGTWDDAIYYLTSDNYRNNPGPLKKILYKILIKNINRKIEKMRSKN
ncbi:MAG: transglutaminase-like domain-containing protein [Promethearchaeota archaeon]